jgi:hypothetical protein
MQKIWEVITFVFLKTTMVLHEQIYKRQNEDVCMLTQPIYFYKTMNIKMKNGLFDKFFKSIVNCTEPLSIIVIIINYQD